MAMVVTVAPSAQAAPANPSLAQVHDFAFGLGLNANDPAVLASLEQYDLVVIDGELTKPATVARLRAAGVVVLGYLSVGTIEPFRSWYRKLKPYALGDRFKQFGETYADVAARGFRREIARRIAPRLLRKGFDGLFLDNTDMVETHKSERTGMRRLVRSLSDLVHGRGGLLFAQNGDSSVGALLRFYDGWNREDVTWTYSFKRRRYVHQSAAEVAQAQGALRRIGALGLLVTATDYTRRGENAATQESIANACTAGALPFVSDIGLTRLPAAPLSCGSP
ncbi:MAG: polysaccharide biosynthesis protein PelA [Solirubrobacterales bacterium]|nr:polysaccharide biosynthesis protein PelA [Solirubrobacterales bacterium]